MDADYAKLSIWELEQLILKLQDQKDRIRKVMKIITDLRDFKLSHGESREKPLNLPEKTAWFKRK